MAVKFPQFDNEILGGSDTWDNDNAGVILLDDYFGVPSGAPTTYIVSANTTGTFANTGLSSVEDTRLRELNPTTNYATATTFSATSWVSGDTETSVIRFNGLSGLGVTTVTNAEIGFNLDNINGFTNYEIREALRAWVEAQATWNIYSTGNNWQAGGGVGALDSGGTALDTQGNSTAGTWIVFSGPAVDALVQSWCTGGANNGVLLRPANLSAFNTTSIGCVSSNGTDGLRPYLRFDGVSSVSGGSVSQTFDINYRVLNTASQTFNLNYRVLNATSLDFGLNYRVFNAISQSYDLSYRVFNAVSQIFDLSYGVINTGSVSQAFDMSYRVLNAVNQAFNVNYRVLNAVNQSFNFNYRVLNASSQTYDISYRVFNAASQTYNFNYRIFNAVNQPYDISYRVFNAVSQIFDISYGIVNIGSVSQAFDMSYRVLNAVNQAFDVNYRVLNAANQVFDASYRVFNAAAQSFEFNYRVLNSISQTQNYAWRVLNNAEYAFDISYKVGDFDYSQVPELNNIGNLINKALLKNDLTPLPGLSVFGDAVLLNPELQPVQSGITLQPISPSITWQKLH